MEKRIDCSDMGIDCDYRTCSPTQEEVIRKVGEHIQTFHGMGAFSRDFYQRARSVVHEGSCERPKDCSGGVCKL